jgi:protoporphyrinogen oxidase
VDGFHFDCTGHLIHFRTPDGRRIITELVGNRIQEHQRKAAIFLQNRFTDYPFQANTYGLPAEVIKECLLGFVETFQHKKNNRINNFYDWVLDTFGAGIAKYFMIPYNEKLWQHDLHDIALDWVNWSIPKPNLEEVLNGALGIRNKQFGYNPVFYYPMEGGIGLLPKSFPVKGNLHLSNPVKSIHLKKRRVTLKDGKQFRYRYLLSTMPLHSLIQSLEDAPARIRTAGGKLEYVSVLNINLGIEREDVIPYHWVYFPERDKPFYRIGCPSNFSQKVAPRGTTSLFVEVSLRPQSQHDVDQLVSQSIAALKQSGILRMDDKIPVIYPVLLPYAYVIYNKERQNAVAKIQKYLQAHDVFSFGRYGSWIYSSMEDAVLQGKEFAEKIMEARNTRKALS